MLLASVAIGWPTTLGPMANPADPTYLPRPEWYYVPVFQWLKYWHGPLSVLGIVVIPALLFLVLFALPFIDRSSERRPLRRPVALSAMIAVFGSFVALGALSYAEDRRDPDVRKKLDAQADEERRFASAPFEPLEIGASTGANKLTAAASKGALLFVSQSCVGCHGPEAKGGAGLFRLGDMKKHSAEELKALLEKPSPKMVEGGMEPALIRGEDLDSLVAYLFQITEGR
jgi:mono/diheme cytochrome c family protein